MDIRGSLDSLRSLLGVDQAVSPASQSKSSSATVGSALASDQATLSSAGNEVSLTASAEGVRADKIAAVQEALKAGTYDVPASAVASKVVDAMLGSNR